MHSFKPKENGHKIPEGIEIKEGIVLDENDNPISGPETRPRGLSFGISLGPILGAIFVTLLLFAGVTLFATVASVVLGIWLIRSLLRFLGLLPAKRF